MRHPLATISSSGEGSGCQGCDLTVRDPIGMDPIRVCDPCARIIPDQTTGMGLLEWVSRRRAELRRA